MPELSYELTLEMRRNYIGKSCKLHFDTDPIKIVRASKQYMYDNLGNEYLDCINNVAHVGHCHPHVVSVGQEQMARLATCNGFLNENLSNYAKRMIETLPEKLCICYFVNSGSEANDLALRLAKAYTKHKDVMVFDNAYHGNLGNLLDISPLKYKKLRMQKKKYVHIIPCPDTYRGIYRDTTTPNAAQCYVDDVKRIIEEAHENGRQIGALLSEALISQAGVISPPSGYLSQLYRCVREAGGLCIADEVQVGLGRIGDHYWSFQAHDIIPDIVTCGKPLGNGHPMAMVVTTKEIAESLGDFASSFGGNPVSCAIGCAVLDVIRNEQLMSSAKFVGRTLLEGFRNIQDKHPMMGDIRGQGLIVAVELVTTKESRKPAPEAAEQLAYKMKEEKVIIANDGPEKNVMSITPPMCFTIDNARRVVECFDKCLTEVENGLLARTIESQESQMDTSQVTIPVDVINIDEDDLHGNSDDDGQLPGKRPRFEDLD